MYKTFSICQWTVRHLSWTFSRCSPPSLVISFKTPTQSPFPPKKRRRKTILLSFASNVNRFSSQGNSGPFSGNSREGVSEMLFCQWHARVVVAQYNTALEKSPRYFFLKIIIFLFPFFIAPQREKTYFPSLLLISHTIHSVSRNFISKENIREYRFIQACAPSGRTPHTLPDKNQLVNSTEFPSLSRIRQENLTPQTITIPRKNRLQREIRYFGFSFPPSLFCGNPAALVDTQLSILCLGNEWHWKKERISRRRGKKEGFFHFLF